MSLKNFPITRRETPQQTELIRLIGRQSTLITQMDLIDDHTGKTDVVRQIDSVSRTILSLANQIRHANLKAEPEARIPPLVNFYGIETVSDEQSDHRFFENTEVIYEAA